MISSATVRHEFALVGEAPNLAARLQALAGANQILVAPRTRRLLGDLFELADLGEHSIKGLDDQVRRGGVAVRPGLIATDLRPANPPI